MSCDGHTLTIVGGNQMTHMTIAVNTSTEGKKVAQKTETIDDVEYTVFYEADD